MSRHTRHHRAVFDPGLTYVVSREFRFNGALLEPGAVFEPTRSDPRRMQQLYDARFIQLAPNADGRRIKARRAILIGGVGYAPGETIPRDAIVSPGRLAQLVARGDVGLEQAGRARRAQPRRAMEDAGVGVSA